jgi:hypothetical protein
METYFTSHALSKENIFIYLKYNKITQEELEKIVDYDIITQYGYLILGIFGSNYYNNLKNKIIDDKISKINKEELNKIITYEILINNKDIIINKFGSEYYDEYIAKYN